MPLARVAATTTLNPFRSMSAIAMSESSRPFFSAVEVRRIVNDAMEDCVGLLAGPAFRFVIAARLCTSR